MIAFVRGTIESRDVGGVVIAVGGVGLRVSVPSSTLARLGGLGAEATLHTHLYVREDALALYGFARDEERRAFETLLTVTGVGPRGALGLLSALSVEQLGEAISRGNADLLTVVPGIGKRIASRIVLDLKGKLGPKVAVGGPSAMSGTGDGEVMDALTQVFGYTPQQAAEAVAALGPDAPTSTEERIRVALRHFATR
ncbi:MAG: Holliday junction branch migration protein RuvA [Chloroflexota bacterium]|nr:MAG: Holliday junction branch migration protein RuvA [Chloroflexota bacterium]